MMIVSVPLSLGYLGQERYGMLVTLTSIGGMLGFADLGLGNGLVNAIAEAYGHNDRESARRCVSSAFFILSVVSLIVVIALAVGLNVAPWPRVFNVTSVTASGEAGLSAAVFICCFAVTLPLTVAQKVQAGYQESFITSLWQAAGTVFALATLVFVVQRRASLPWMVLSLAGGPMLAALLNSAWVFKLKRRWLAPRLSLVDGDTAQRLLRTGSLFLVLQLSAAVAYQTDSLIVAQVLGAKRVPEYAVPMTLFQVSPFLLSLVLTPLWPAYAESLASGDVGWIRKSFRRSLILALSVNVPAAILLTLGGRSIIRLWVGSAIGPSSLLLFSLGAWTIVNSFNGPLAMLLNGIQALRFQVVCALTMAVANLGLSIVLTHRVGVAGVVLGTVVSQVLFILLPSFIFVPRVLARMRPSAVNAFHST